MSIEISPIEIERLPFAPWKTMWLDYLGKQAEALGPEQNHITYSRLVDPDFNLCGVVAGAAEPIGFAHFYFHPSTFHALASQRPRARSGSRAG